jgi:hypothetical protein
MAKFMLIMRATDDALREAEQADFDEVIAAMGRFNESMIKAGVLVGGEGLAPEPGLIVDFTEDPPAVTEGPYADTEARFNGFWIIQVPSIEDAADWAKRAPLGPGNRIEIRRVSGIEDFPEANEWVQKEAEWRKDEKWGEPLAG